jgi:hypothetical protein
MMVCICTVCTTGPIAAVLKKDFKVFEINSDQIRRKYNQKVPPHKKSEALLGIIKKEEYRYCV